MTLSIPTETTEQTQTATAESGSTHALRVDVVVCIVTHNSRDDLEVCLSKLHEVMPAHLRVTVTVVDNTGTDGSSEYVRAAWPAVHVITNRQPQGLGANVNAAALGAAARSEGGDARSDANIGARSDANIGARYTLVMNPDVVLLPGAIETLVKYMDEHPEAGACGPKTLYPDGTLQATCRQFPNWGTVFWRWLKLDRLWLPSFYRHSLMMDWDHASSRPVDWLMASCILVRTEAFRAIDGFDTGFFLYYEDIDLCRRLWQTGYGVHYVAEAVVIHKYQRHSAATLVNPLTLIHVQSILQYRRKHGMAFGQVRNQNLWMWLTLALVICDLAATQLALQAARYLRLLLPLFGAYPYPVPSPLKPVIYLIVPVIWFVVFTLLGLYSIRHVRNYRREVGRLLIGVLLAGLALAGAVYGLFLYDVYIPRLLLAYFLAIDWLLLVLVRSALRRVISRNGLFYQPRTLVVGVGEAGRHLADCIGRDVYAQHSLIGIVPWPQAAATAAEEQPLRTLMAGLDLQQIDEVILTPPVPDPALMSPLVAALRDAGVHIRIVPDCAEPAADGCTSESLYGTCTLVLGAPSAADAGRLQSVLRRVAGE